MVKEGNFRFPQTEMPSPSTFYLGFLDLPRHWVPVLCSIPDSNPCLTRQPHGLCAFSFLFPLFFSFPFFLSIFPPSFISLSLFFFFLISPWNVPSLASPCLNPRLSGSLFLLTRGSRFANWECYSVCGLVWVLWPSLAQSNPLGEVGPEWLCRRGEQRAALCSLDTKGKCSAPRWDQAWVWWLSVAPHLGWAKWHARCWHFYKVTAWERGPPLKRIPWC